MDDEKFLDSEEAATYLGYRLDTLKVSRCTGMLAAVEAPPYIKRGSRVFYEREDLDDWLSQFGKRTHTKQATA